MALDDDLTAYYAAEARDRRRLEPQGFRVELRRRFADVLRSEGRTSLVDVGAGPGVDTVAWRADGFRAVGVDLVVDNCRLASDRDVPAVAASLYDEPFRSAAFDALWTMSTFVHVPRSRVDDALRELVRIVRPGAPLGIGTWGGRDFEGRPEFGDLRPYRFFSLASHDRWRATLSGHGTVELFETFPPTDPSGWEYQFAIVRAGG